MLLLGVSVLWYHWEESVTLLNDASGHQHPLEFIIYILPLVCTVFIFISQTLSLSLSLTQTFASLAGKLELTTPRDAFITALCKSCLPPHYTLTVLNNASVAASTSSSAAAASSSSVNRGHQRSPSQESQHQYYDAEVCLSAFISLVCKEVLSSHINTPSIHCTMCF